ncbi:MAG: hypothetical protein M9901_10530 [Lentimicrobium sp.]|nr:hypothetical protein [Lentimicrobium sp.]
MKEFIHEIDIDKQIKPKMAGYLLVESDPNDPDRSQNILSEGIRNFFGGFGNRAHIYSLGKFIFALLIPDEIHKLDICGFIRDKRDFAFIEGTFYESPTPDSLIKNRKDAGNYLAEEILNICRSGNPDKLKELNGRYSGFSYLYETDTLIIFNDQLGGNRIYVYDNSKVFAISNNVFALASNPALQISINEQSIAEILQLEYPLYRNTEFNEITLIVPSDIYIRKGKSVVYRKYYQKFDRSRKMSDNSYIEGLKHVIDSFFKKLYQQVEEPLGIFMSKGKDSRIFLPFMEHNQIPYIPYVFKDGTGVFDYPYVKRIAELLQKDLHVLESYSIDRRLAFMIAMSTTPTFSWGALGSLASGYSSTALMGLFGDMSSGKMPSFRVPGIKTRDDMIHGIFDWITKGVTREIFKESLTCYNKYDIWNQYTSLYKEYPESELLIDTEIHHDTDNRSFRNTQPILLRAQHFLTPVTPFADREILKAYHSLPASLIRSQKAHAKIAATEQKSNSVRSTAFPVSLKLESRIRPAMLQIIRFNNRNSNLLLRWQIKKFNPYVETDQFIPRSDYFRNLFIDKKSIRPGHKRLLTRMYNTDDYLHLIFHDNIRSFCRTPDIVYNEMEAMQKN